MAPEPISVEVQRENMAGLNAEGVQYIGKCPPHLGEAYLEIQLPDGRTNHTLVVWPKPASGDAKPLECPLIVHFHGGGFSVSGPDMLGAPARGFATMFKAIVVCPSLNQLPEQAFPAPVEIAWEVCAWLSKASNLNDGLLKDEGTRVDPSRGFIVGGLSAGGTAGAVIGGIQGAASANLKEFAHLSPLQSPITGIFAGIPTTVTEEMIPEKYRPDLKSRVENSDPEGFIIVMIKELERMIGMVDSPWFSPINLDLSDPRMTKDHPPKVFVFCGAKDAYRDDAIIYQKWLSEEVKGVESRVVVMEGGHMGWISPPIPECHSKEMREMHLDGMAWLLNTEWDRTQPLPV